MDVSDLKGLFGEVKKRMDAHVDFVRKELSQVRTGRATTGLLDTVFVEAYGSKMPLNQVAGLSIPEPTMIIAQPFDSSLMGAIERGYWADFIIVDRDPTKVGPQDLGQTKVLETWVAGEKVFSAAE